MSTPGRAPLPELATLLPQPACSSPEVTCSLFSSTCAPLLRAAKNSARLFIHLQSLLAPKDLSSLLFSISSALLQENHGVKVPTSAVSAFHWNAEGLLVDGSWSLLFISCTRASAKGSVASSS